MGKSRGEGIVALHYYPFLVLGFLLNILSIHFTHNKGLLGFSQQEQVDSLAPTMRIDVIYLMGILDIIPSLEAGSLLALPFENRRSSDGERYIL